MPTTPPVPLDLQYLWINLPETDFSLRVEDWGVAAGECVALVGKNGCGKSSLMEAVLGLRSHQGMRGTLLGADFRTWSGRADLRHQIGVLLQRSAPPAGMYVRDLVRLHGNLYRRSVPRVRADLGVDLLADKKYDHLSRGETQRVNLFMALAHEPALAILDEPFTGLDAHYAQAVARLLAERGGGAVLMCCHGEAELALADRVTWIADGAVRADAAPAQLRRSLLSEYRLQARFTDVGAAHTFGEVLAALDGTRWDRVHDQVTVLAEDTQALDRVRAALAACDVAALEFGQTSLGDLLQHCAGHDVETGEAHV